MGGMTSALASIPGWGWAALGVLAVAGIASGRGETRSGAAYVEDASGKATKQQGPSGGEIAGDQARAMFDATKIKIQDTLKLVGSSATVSGFVAGLESSKDGHGFAYAGGLVNGVGFGDYKGRDGGQFGTASRTPEEAVRDYQNELKKATLEALQTAADIPAVISSQLKGVDINALDQAGLDNLTAAVGTIIDTVSAFTTLVATGGIAELRDLSFSAAAALIQFSGGLEALQTNLTAYYTNFYSAEEQRAQTIANINKVTAGSGFDAATASRDSFRALVESQDLTTTSGQATYAALISVAGAFAQLTPTLAAAAAAVDTALASLKNDAANLGVDLLTAQGDTAGAAAARRAIDTAGMSALAVAQYDANNATRALIASLENLKVSAAAALESTTNSANKAMAALQRAVAAQAKIYQVQVDAAQLAVSEIQGIFDTLESSITTLRGQVDSTQQAAQGRAFIDNALANAQTTGYLPDSKALSGAISAAMSDSTVYASQAESDFAKLSLAGSMSKLKDISSTQLSAAEQTLQYAQDQLTALDTILSNAQLQLDAANGIDVSVISVAAAVNNLSTAILTMEAERMKQGLPASLATTTAKYVADIGPNANVDPAAAVATTVFEQQISDLYTSTLGRAADTAGLAYWAGSGLSIATIAQEITKSAESSMRSVSVATQNEFMTMVNAAYGKTNSITAFAVGTNYVPRDMMANIHEGEAIVPKAYNPAAGGGQSDRLESLVEGLTKEVQRLQAIVNDGNAHARRTADTLDSVTEGGSNMRTVAT
jgi:hypothetical protein